MTLLTLHWLRLLLSRSVVQGKCETNESSIYDSLVCFALSKVLESFILKKSYHLSVIL